MRKTTQEPSELMLEATLVPGLEAVTEAWYTARHRFQAQPGAGTLTTYNERIFADIHNSVIRRIEELSKAIERGESYTSMHVCDDMELIVSRLMTDTQIDSLELEPRSLPEGFERLSLRGSVPDSSENATNQAALAATAA
jgi:hypothetical protein